MWMLCYLGHPRLDPLILTEFGGEGLFHPTGPPVIGDEASAKSMVSAALAATERSDGAEGGLRARLRLAPCLPSGAKYNQKKASAVIRNMLGGAAGGSLDYGAAAAQAGAETAMAATVIRHDRGTSLSLGEFQRRTARYHVLEKYTLPLSAKIMMRLARLLLKIDLGLDVSEADIRAAASITPRISGVGRTAGPLDREGAAEVVFAACKAGTVYLLIIIRESPPGKHEGWKKVNGVWTSVLAIHLVAAGQGIAAAIRAGAGAMPLPRTGVFATPSKSLRSAAVDRLAGEVVAVPEGGALISKGHPHPHMRKLPATLDYFAASAVSDGASDGISVFDWGTSDRSGSTDTSKLVEVFRGYGYAGAFICGQDAAAEVWPTAFIKLKGNVFCSDFYDVVTGPLLCIDVEASKNARYQIGVERNPPKAVEAARGASTVVMALSERGTAAAASRALLGEPDQGSPASVIINIMAAATGLVGLLKPSLHLADSSSLGSASARPLPDPPKEGRRVGIHFEVRQSTGKNPESLPVLDAPSWDGSAASKAYALVPDQFRRCPRDVVMLNAILVSKEKVDPALKEAIDFILVTCSTGKATATDRASRGAGFGAVLPDGTFLATGTADSADAAYSLCENAFRQLPKSSSGVIRHVVLTFFRAAARLDPFAEGGLLSLAAKERIVLLIGDLLYAGPYLEDYVKDGIFLRDGPWKDFGIDGKSEMLKIFATFLGAVPISQRIEAATRSGKGVPVGARTPAQAARDKEEAAAAFALSQAVYKCKVCEARFALPASLLI